VSRGVRHVLDDVQQVRLDERGFVRELQLERGGVQPVELVIDCTGFRGLIIGEALGEPWLPLDRYVLCDRAMVAQLPNPIPNSCEPCVTATALGAGWAWNLPLYTRVGTGYVYSSAFRSDDQAQDDYVRYLEQRGLRLEHAPRVIPMKIGWRRRSWVKNCVAIGLSSSFVEPLEATAIHAIAVACRHLASNFPDRAMSPAFARRFDKSLGELMVNILDFIVLHYYSSNREEPFWRASRDGIELPASLAENLDIWRHVMPAPADITGVHLFAPWSFLAVLYAKGWYDDVAFPLEGSLAREDWHGFAREMDGIKQRLVAQLPDNYALLTHIRAQAARRMFGGAPAAAPRPAAVG
jgi:tryptophan halogenase